MILFDTISSTSLNKTKNDTTNPIITNSQRPADPINGDRELTIILPIFPDILPVNINDWAIKVVKNKNILVVDFSINSSIYEKLYKYNGYSKIAKNIYAIYPKYSNEYLDTNTPTVPTISWSGTKFANVKKIIMNEIINEDIFVAM